MSKTLDAAFITIFDTEVKQAYQGMGMSLRAAVKTKTTKGSTVRFQNIGKGLATVRITQSDVTVMNLAHTVVNATMVDYTAAEYTDIFDQEKVNFEEREPIVLAIAGAIGRRDDQIILDAWDAASTTLTVAKTVGANDGADGTKIRRAKRLLDDQGVPTSDRFFVHSPQFLEQLLGNTAATSIDFNNVRLLVDGELDTWLGFKWIMIEARTAEGGLPLAGNDRTNYAVHKTACGLGLNLDKKVEINYVPEKTSWLVNGLYSAGAVAIDALGIVEIVVDESVVVNN